MNARTKATQGGGAAAFALIVGILSAGTLPGAPAKSCKCLAAYPVCTEVTQTNLIFIGTVESIEPAFLDPWNPGHLSLIPVDEMMRLRQEGSASSLAKLKAIYLKLYPNMPEYFRKEIEEAKTHDELRRAAESLSGEGRQARIRVKTVFRHKADDDDDDKGGKKHDDDDDDKPKDKKNVNGDKKDAVKKDAARKVDVKDNDDDDDNTLVGTIVTVWTDAGGCGYDFQKDETYLVYADDDEETGELTTSICRRTARLSDAGHDLAYLYYYKNGGDQSTRLEGFVTTEPGAVLQVDRGRFAASVDSPVPDAVIQLKPDQHTEKPTGDKPADGTPRYTRADAGGKFIFDGLGAGDYELTVFDELYPRTVRQLGFSARFHAAAKSCASQLLSVPKD